MRPLVFRIWQTTCLARSGEAVLLGLGLGFLTLAASSTPGAGLGWVSLGLAVATGLAFGVSWYMDQKPQPRAVAQLIDRGLRMGGALTTAFEAEQRGEASEVLGLLALSVRARVKVRAALRAALPNSLPFLAAPLIGATVLFSVRHQPEPAPPLSAWVAPALGAMGDRLQQAKDLALENVEAGLQDAQAAGVLADLERRTRALEESCQQRSGPPEEAAERAQALRAQLEGIERDLRPLVSPDPNPGTGNDPSSGTPATGLDNPVARPGFQRALEQAAAHLESAEHALDQLSGRRGSQGTEELGRGEGAGGARYRQESNPELNSNPSSTLGETSIQSEQAVGPDPGGVATSGQAAGGEGVPTGDSGLIQGFIPGFTLGASGADPLERPSAMTGGLSGLAHWPRRHRELARRWMRQRQAERKGAPRQGAPEERSD